MKRLTVQEDGIGNVDLEVVPGADVIFFEVGCTNQTLLLVRTNVQLVLTNRLICTTVADLRMVM